MATTRLMPLHTGKGRTVGQSISNIIDYTENPQKTDGGRLITSWQCDSRIADAEFLFTKNQYIQLIAAIPYRRRLDTLQKSERTKLLIDLCAEIFVAAEEYFPSVYAKRNRYMVERSDRVIAVYDGREKGGTVGTIRLAHSMKKELREIAVGEILIPEHLKQQ